jgi:hypothetical protein
MSKKVQKFLNRAFENNDFETDYSIQDEVNFIKALTDDPIEIICFFDNKYQDHEEIRFNRKTMTLEYI